MGATAGQSLFGPSFRVGVSRGKALDLDGRAVIATIHPSAVLRSRSSDDRAEAFGGLVSDLRSEEHTSELQSLMRISYAVFCLKKKKKNKLNTRRRQHTENE